MKKQNSKTIKETMKVKCEICGREFMQITGSHLKTHGITSDEYRKRFPDVIFMSESYKKAHFIGEKNHMNGVEPWNKGETKETNEIVKGYGEEIGKTKKIFFASEKGKLFAKEMSKTKTEFFASEEGQKWLDENYRGENHPTYGKEPWNFGLTKETDERVKKNGEGVSKTKKEFFATEEGKLYAKNYGLIMHENWQDPEFVKKVTDSWSKKPNQPEKGLDSIVQLLFPKEYKYNGNYELGITIGGKIPDFVNVNGKKKAIDVFGDYWYEGEDPQIRIDLFKEYGWDLLVIWEHELKDRDAVIQKIIKFHGVKSDYVLIQKTLDRWIDGENNQKKEVKMPEKVLKRVDKYLIRILRGSDRKMEKVVPTKSKQIEKTKQIEVRAGEEGESSIVVSIVEGESNKE